MYDLSTLQPPANLGPNSKSSISIHRTYNLIADLKSRQKNMHFQKKRNLIWSPDEPVPSIWSGKNWDFGVAEKFRNRELKPPAPMCRSRNSTPKQKKKSRKKESVWGRYRCLKIVVAVIFLESRPRIQKSNGFRFCLKCPIWIRWWYLQAEIRNHFLMFS